MYFYSDILAWNPTQRWFIQIAKSEFQHNTHVNSGAGPMSVILYVHGGTGGTW